jgi:hypothetical protein
MTSKAPLKIWQTNVPGFRFGTAAMLICLSILLGYQLVNPDKVRIERKVETSGEGFQKRLPTIDSLLASQEKLSLSKEQVTVLTDLREKEQAQLKGVEAQISELTKRVGADLKGANAQISLVDLQVLAMDISAPSKRKRAIEKRFSNDSWRVLSEDQKLRASQIFSGATESGH